MAIGEGLVLFNNGEGLDYTDLNNIGEHLSHRIEDKLLYTGPNQAFISTTSFEDGWNDGSILQGRCFSFGGLAGGFVVTGATTFRLLPGIIGQWKSSGAIAENVNNFLTYQVDKNEYTGSITLPVTLTRYDTIQFKVDSVNGSSESRDFKDATTGALTTSVINKKKNRVATFNIKTGTEGGGIPTVDAGYTMLGVIKASTSAITDLYSTVLPIRNGLHHFDSIGSNCILLTGTSYRDWGAAVINSGNEGLFYPGPYSSDSQARVIEIELNAVLYSPTIQLILAYNSTTSNIVTLTSEWPHANGVQGTHKFDFRPEAATRDFSVWGSGSDSPKGAPNATLSTYRHLALRIAGSGGTSFISSVRWFIGK
jgi:hypothetical protein